MKDTKEEEEPCQERCISKERYIKVGRLAYSKGSSRLTTHTSSLACSVSLCSCLERFRPVNLDDGTRLQLGKQLPVPRPRLLAVGVLLQAVVRVQ